MKSPWPHTLVDTSHELDLDFLTEIRKAQASKARMESDSFCLVQIHPVGDSGSYHQLLEDEVLLGRSDHCHIQLSEDAVSREHVLFRREGGSYKLLDLNSTNGVLVNDVKVERALLIAGDYVQVGTYIFKFITDDHIESMYHQTVYQMVTSDRLTSAYNKAYLMDVMEREMMRASRAEQCTSVLFLDFDRFKSINDEHGHLVGDQILQEFCHRALAAIRRCDVLSRYGGEEFVVMLCDANPVQAHIVAERIRSSIEKTPFQTDDGEIYATISIGIATQRASNSFVTPQELIHQADLKLYLAKQSGRNQIKQ